MGNVDKLIAATRGTVETCKGLARAFVKHDNPQWRDVLLPLNNYEDAPFIVGIAVTGAVVDGLGKFVPEAYESIVADTFHEGLRAWDERFVPTMEDLFGFTERNMAAGMNPYRAVGIWIILNLRGTEPTDAELSVTRYLGYYVELLGSKASKNLNAHCRWVDSPLLS